MYNGTTKTNPFEVYSSNLGLDNRLARSGMYGQGIYFANNCQYSTNFHYNMSKGGEPIAP